MSIRKQQFLVTIAIPEDYTVTEVREYMRDAISSWSGQFHPDNSLFGWFWNFNRNRPQHLTIRPVKGVVK